MSFLPRSGCGAWAISTGIGHEEAAEPVCALIWINKLDWLMLAHSAHDVVAIDEAKGKFASRH